MLPLVAKCCHQLPKVAISCQTPAAPSEVPRGTIPLILSNLDYSSSALVTQDPNFCFLESKLLDTHLKIQVRKTVPQNDLHIEILKEI